MPPQDPLPRALHDLKIAVFIEHKFIPEEIQCYEERFAAYGASVQFISRLWWGDYKPGHQHWSPPVYYSDVDPQDDQPWTTPVELAMSGGRDVSEVKPEDFAAVIMAANYTSVRLRFTDDESTTDPRQYVQSAPAVRFFAEAMANPAIVKGALCHGLWVLTPHPELLKGRKVTCHTVVAADVLNCGAEIQFNEAQGRLSRPKPVVIDHDLVTGYSKKEVAAFVDAVANAILARRV